jgi:transcriptional regulator with XRE-family HTH domain
MAKTKKIDRPHLAVNISKRRKALGWSQDDLANEVGVHVNTIKDIERGLSEGRADTRQAIASALKCEVWELLKPAIKQAPDSVPSDDPQKQGKISERGIQSFANVGEESESSKHHERDTRRDHHESVNLEFSHTIASAIAAEVVTALKSESALSPAQDQLLAVIRDLEPDQVGTLLNIARRMIEERESNEGTRSEQKR